MKNHTYYQNQTNELQQKVALASIIDFNAEQLQSVEDDKHYESLIKRAANIHAFSTGVVNIIMVDYGIVLQKIVTVVVTIRFCFCGDA